MYSMAFFPGKYTIKAQLCMMWKVNILHFRGHAILLEIIMIYFIFCYLALTGNIRHLLMEFETENFILLTCFAVWCDYGTIPKAITIICSLLFCFHVGSGLCFVLIRQEIKQYLIVFIRARKFHDLSYPTFSIRYKS